MNLSLFSTKPDESGFRLHTYEVWNWGTFDHQIWSIEPGGETSLLTGANASGKTTLVDGLLTLLVPEKRMRFYNQTAGAKGERTEDSYVTGEYGETENETTGLREIKKLRPDKSKAQSVLLAVFQNETHFVTLVQARWFAGGELKKAFILAHKQLSVSADFMPFDHSGDWKKRLRQKYPKQGAKDPLLITDSPGEYGRLMRKTFGMRSEKAHTLFSQTIGLKVLGNLDEFVRLQMLEERDAESEYQKVRIYFRTLNDAHQAIEKITRQIELLLPIRAISVTLTRQKADLKYLEDCKNVLPLWFATRAKGLIETFLAGELTAKAAVDVRIADLKDQIDALDRKRIMVAVQIESDEVGRQIADLEKDNRNLTREKESREKDLQRYNQLAEQLDLQANPQSISLFNEQIQTVKNKKNVFTTELKKLAENIYQAKKTRDNLQQEFDDLSNELSVLRAQKNNITGAPARIRAELLEFTGATEQEIPFVGELIKIKSSEAVWESAIERLLHHFALQLIIPDQYYGQVSQYVNQNDLKGRIIYQKFNKKAVAPGIFPSSDPDELITKLEFKASAYTEWVKNEINRKFNYNCTDDLETFRLSDKALTSAGQTKNAARHEKDDRPEIKNRQFYILGWDNKEKIAVLKEAVTQLNGRISEVEKTITYLQNQETRIRKATENITSFLAFDNYKKIDWWTLSAQIQENTSRIAELQETNDRVKTLKEQMDGLIKSIAALTGELDTAKDELRTLESNISQQEQKLREAINTLHNYEGMAVAEQLSRFESQFMQNLEINMETIEGLRSKRQQKLGDDISTLKDRLRELETEAEGLMRAFIQPDRQIIDQFEDWNADTHRLRDRAEFIDEYLATLTRLEEQELVEYKLQFKKYLNEEMITKMSDFQTWLEMQEEEIDGNIETLNGSLDLSG